MPGFFSGFLLGLTPGGILLDFVTPADLGPYAFLVIFAGLAVTLFGILRSRSLGSGFITGLVIGFGLGFILLGLI